MVPRHIAQILAYILVACAAAFSIVQVERDQRDAERRSNAAREAIAQAGIDAVKFGCLRDSRTIKQLRIIIINGKDSINQYEREGTLTHVQAIRARAQSDKALSRLPVPDCGRITMIYRKNLEP